MAISPLKTRNLNGPTETLSEPDLHNLIYKKGRPDCVPSQSVQTPTDLRTTRSNPKRVDPKQTPIESEDKHQ